MNQGLLSIYKPRLHQEQVTALQLPLPPSKLTQPLTALIPHTPNIISMVAIQPLHAHQLRQGRILQMTMKATRLLHLIPYLLI